jgi:gamma-glutamylcyclotransferase (GGCT)/AIG2-like uncharacterized protein YtfP
MKYFAYGMNTNIKEMAQRCPDAKNLGHARLAGYRFRFAGHADIVPHANGLVEGVLWEITDRCLTALDNLEGFPYYYDRKEVTVVTDTGVEEALVYYMTEGMPEGMPSTGYRDMVMDGYTQNHIPVNQILEALSSIRYNAVFS